jgi:hypothetical protein
MNVLRKTLIAGLALATLGASFAVSTAPAAAKPWGWGWGAAGLATGLAIGAAAASTTTPYYGYGYGCYIARQPFYDDYGNYLGSRRVRVCN